MTAPDYSDDEWVYTLSNDSERQLKCRMLVGRHTGATVNTLPASYADNTKPTTRKLKMWNSKKAAPLGICHTVVKNPKNKKTYSIEFVVLSDNYTPLLGYKTAKMMKLMKINEQNIEKVATVSLVEQHPGTLDGKLGALPGKVHLKVDETIHPTVMPTRRTLSLFIQITKVEEPTPWVSQLVVVTKKNGGVRVCIDRREPNKAILREHYTLPIIEDTLHELGQSCMFTEADLSSGYWQLDRESSMLTTFQTCYDRYRFVRLPFGTTVSSERFQKKLLEALAGLPGVVCTADDIIICGKDLAEHDRNIIAFVERYRDNGIKLNREN